MHACKLITESSKSLLAALQIKVKFLFVTQFSEGG